MESKMKSIQNKVMTVLIDELSNELCTIALHGSSVLGELKPSSDLDFLVIVNEPLSESQKKNLDRAFLKLSKPLGESGNQRYLEISIFDYTNLHDNLGNYRVEYIYGEWLRNSILKDETVNNEYDDEYIVMLKQALIYNKIIYGNTSLSEYIPSINQSDFERALKRIVDSIDLKNIVDDIRNITLTLCRIIYTVKTNAFASKDDAARYVQDSYELSEHTHRYIDECIDNYVFDKEMNYTLLEARKEIQLLKDLALDTMLKKGY